MEGIVMAGAGAPLMTSSHQINHNIPALCIRCNEGIMGDAIGLTQYQTLSCSL
jgi:hypothetical protein